VIIDAHVHLPVINESRTYEESCDTLVADLKRDGVEHAILIPDNVRGSTIGDVPTCLKLVESRPELFLMGAIDVRRDGPEWIREIERLLSKRRIVAMKIFPGHEPVYPTDRRLFPMYELCEAHGAPVVIHTGFRPTRPEVARYNDPKHIVKVATRYAKLKIVIAHLFLPKVDYCYETTRDYPQIYYDTSGLADAEVIAWTGRERIEETLLKILADDPKKVIFGTDYAMCSPKDHIEMIEQLGLTEEVRERVFWRNAVEVFRLENSRLKAED